jgi:hypothetical protein
LIFTFLGQGFEKGGLTAAVFTCEKSDWSAEPEDAVMLQFLQVEGVIFTGWKPAVSSPLGTNACCDLLTG